MVKATEVEFHFVYIDVNSEWVPGIDGGSVTQSFLYVAEVICRGSSCSTIYYWSREDVCGVHKMTLMPTS